MNVCVFGLWHLGTVTAACLASGGHRVIGLDDDPGVIEGLTAGRPPVFEPGLEEMVKTQQAAGRLSLTTDATSALAEADVLWVTFDTPVDDDDRGDVEFVVQRVARLFPAVRSGTLVLISSQLPVGTTRRLEELFAAGAAGRVVGFGAMPENLRLGAAINVFTQPDRVIAGIRDAANRDKVAALLAPFTDRIVWMSVESAEMTKHALNAFLATSVTFINEIATICEQVGADAGDVERGLKSEARIGPKAYLGPGGAFAGGTLARDIMFLSEMAQTRGLELPLISSVHPSNRAHRRWAFRRLADLLGGVRGRTIALWGLTYKPGTDTLRRSNAIELCDVLTAEGAIVRAHDPAVTEVPPPLGSRMTLVGDAAAALDGASALVVATSWPEYRQQPPEIVGRMRRKLVLDANRFLDATIGKAPDVEYVSVGRGTF